MKKTAISAAAALLGALIATALVLPHANSQTNQGFYAGNWPQSDWRPFSDSSPFNQQLPANPRLASNSSSLVSALTSGGAPNAIRPGIQDTSSDFYKPTCWARSTDPIYTLHTGGYRHDNEPLHVPQGCKEAAGSDHHLTVIDGNTHWGFWNAKVDNSAHSISGNSTNAGRLTARKASLTGSGTSVDGECGAVAAGFCNLAGIIRAQELQAGVVNHALCITTSKTSGTVVYPAAGSGDGGGGSIPEGTRFQLNMTDSEIAGYPRWKRGVLRAFAHYGAYVADTSGAPSFAFCVESDSQYSAFTNPRTGQKFAARLPIIARNNGVSQFSFSDVPWSRLRAVAVCVTQKTC